MDQAAANMQTETQKPQNYKNNKNRPKHVNLVFPNCETGCEGKESSGMSTLSPSLTNYIRLFVFAMLCRTAHCIKRKRLSPG
jgi:hypothetical protein